MCEGKWKIPTSRTQFKRRVIQDDSNSLATFLYKITFSIIVSISKPSKTVARSSSVVCSLYCINGHACVHILAIQVFAEPYVKSFLAAHSLFRLLFRYFHVRIISNHFTLLCIRFPYMLHILFNWPFVMSELCKCLKLIIGMKNTSLYHWLMVSSCCSYHSCYLKRNYFYVDGLCKWN